MQAQAEHPRTRRYWWLAFLLAFGWMSWRWFFTTPAPTFPNLISPHHVGMLSPVEEGRRLLQQILEGSLLPEELQQVLQDYAETVERIRVTLPISDFQNWQVKEQVQINQSAIDPGLRQQLLAIVDPTSVTPFVMPSSTPTPTLPATATAPAATPIPTLFIPPLFPGPRPTATQVVPTKAPPVSAIPTAIPATPIPTAIPATPIPSTLPPTATKEPLSTDIPLPTITPLPPTPTPLRTTPTPTFGLPTLIPYPYPYPSSR